MKMFTIWNVVSAGLASFAIGLSISSLLINRMARYVEKILSSYDREYERRQRDRDRDD